ncbi:MAG: glycosyltransferase [Chloroflexaceae bacterium]|nr:glycosyltransferase [Chloroflexaceae bacterium]
MKIAFVGPTYPFRGGIAHYSTVLVRHLREAGHTTRFYSYTRQYPTWLFPGSTDKDPSTAALRVECEYILDPINPLTWWQLYRKVRADNPDLLVLQWWVPYWTPFLTVLSHYIKRHTTIPLLFVCHNVVPHDGGGFLDRRLAITVLHRGDAFIVHSEQDRYRLQALLPNANITKMYLPTYADVAQQGRPADLAAARAHLGISADCPILLFFGFVRPYKGLEYLIQAVRLVLQRRRVHLLVVGEIWNEPEFYYRYAREMGVADAVTFVNRYVANEELPLYFEPADVVVLPYISATQSAVVQLAFGFGKPVITTHVGGLPEVVQDGENGLIVPPQDAEALANAIVRFLDEGLGEKFAANARRTAEAQTFAWQTLVQSIEQIQAGLGQRKA